MNRFIIFYVISLIWGPWAVAHPNETSFSDSAFATSTPGEPGDATRSSRVKISVGEQNGFVYKVEGNTNSNYRISVSGDYYNNEHTYSGFTRLFLAVQYPIDSYNVNARDDYLAIDVLDINGYEYYFDILTPSSVSSVRHLRQGQVNATAIIVVGPSRNSGYTTTKSGE